MKSEENILFIVYNFVYLLNLALFNLILSIFKVALFTVQICRTI